MNRSAFLFDPEETSKFEDALRLADRVLEPLASKYRLRLLPHSSKGWPGRTLRGRKLFRTYALRISLDPSYVDTEVLRWDIHDAWMYEYGELLNKTISSRQLAKGVQLDRIDLARILESAVTENFG